MKESFKPGIFPVEMNPFGHGETKDGVVFRLNHLEEFVILGDVIALNKGYVARKTRVGHVGNRPKHEWH